MLKKIVIIFIALIHFTTFSQEKKKIDHIVYDSWNSIADVQQSASGKLISYQINPLKGDGTLFVELIDGSQKRSFARGSNLTISKSEEFVIFQIKPQADTVRTLKLAKAKEDKFPKDSLAIYFPKTDSLRIIPAIKSYQLSENVLFAYLSGNDERKDCPAKKKCKIHKKKGCEKEKTSGTSLHLVNPITGEDLSFDGVTDYQLSKSGDKLIYITSKQGVEDTLSIHVYFTATQKTIHLLNSQLDIDRINFDASDEQLVFMHTTDTNKRKTYALSYWNSTMDSAQLLIDSTTAGLRENYTISNLSSVSFSANGTRLFFGTNLIVKQDPKDSLLEDEKVVLDVWGGTDLKIQPQQLKEKKADEKKTYRTIYTFDNKKLVHLEDELVTRVTSIDKGNGAFGLGYASSPYSISATWDYPFKEDIYLVNFETGEKFVINKAHGFDNELSPSGKFYLYYDGPDSNWIALSLEENLKTNLTEQFKDVFAMDLNGMPYIPESESGVAWTLLDGKEFYLVNSQHNVYALCPSDPSLSFSITNTNKTKDLVTYRLKNFDTDSTYITLENSLLSGVNFRTKSEAYYALDFQDKSPVLTKLIESDHQFIFMTKANESDEVLFRRMSFIDYPELETCQLDFKNCRKLTETNPQQKDYNWGTVEMVEWKSFDGRSLRGLLYKPEDFDTTKSYPMITYFYEKYTQDIHVHYAPKPTASIVFPTEYVSNGYIIFIPDIEYNAGHPAKSAYDCIVSGTDYLTRTNSWIDSTRMGLQGQSWGGYQTAQLITMTGKYRAAMAGAPVSNMFSAYGGVRWGSGLSRMFQYERAQSRIGFTIWEKPELYVENSPLFALNKVTTPLLIMHNDGDGAVPWYQGIELYMGLRRLGQPVWLLNYNGDEHNLIKMPNRVDLSIRMRQFFDYYLLGAPIPVWMEEGVPAISKGKEFGFELK